jgi:predicted membrane-bound spermidine synthase
LGHCNPAEGLTVDIFGLPEKGAALRPRKRGAHLIMDVPPAAPAEKSPPFCVPRPLLYAIFFLSGVSALIYQLCWQRSLLTIFGSNVESAAIVVGSFMVGLGAGSLAGGWISSRPGIPLLPAFAAAEFAIGVCGLFSLSVFKAAGTAVGGGSLFLTGAACVGLLLVPTLFMGSTLPLLVTHYVRSTKNVGASVGRLYFINTLGASAGCLFAALVCLAFLGMSKTVMIAAALNGLAAVLMLLAWRKERRAA